MQYSSQKFDKNVEIQIEDMLTDVSYEVQSLQNIGLIGVNKAPKEISQDDFTQKKLINIIKWVKKNVLDYSYVQQITARIAYILKYGVTTINEDNNKTCILSSVFSDDNEKDLLYKLYITKKDKNFCIHTENIKNNECLETKFFVNLDEYDEEGKEIHSSIEKTIVNTRIYELDGKQFKRISSQQEKQAFTDTVEIGKTISIVIDSTYVVSDPTNSNNDGIIVKDNRCTVTKLPCQNDIVACIYQESSFELGDSNDINNNITYYLARNNSINKLKIVTDVTRCIITDEEFKDAIDGKIDVQQIIDNFDKEHFANLVNLYKGFSDKTK